MSIQHVNTRLRSLQGFPETLTEELIFWGNIAERLFVNWLVTLLKHVKQEGNTLKASGKCRWNNQIITLFCIKVYYYESTMNEQLTIIGLVVIIKETLWMSICNDSIIVNQKIFKNSVLYIHNTFEKNKRKYS